MNNIISFLIATIFIVLVYILHISMYQWTEKLKKEGCDCADLWHRKYINIIAIILIISITINTFTVFLHFNNNFILFLRFILGIVQMFYYITIIDYIRKLKIKECICSENWRREFGFIYTIIILVFISLIFLSSLIALLFIKK